MEGQRQQKKHFYPRPPRGGRPTGQLCICSTICISIHALREEGDSNGGFSITIRGKISIHALREEGDVQIACSLVQTGISIHALREEGDSSPSQHTFCRSNFYPRPPRGGRPPKAPCPPKSRRFLSTPSARRATAEFALTFAIILHFYPRPPRGGRRRQTAGLMPGKYFYPRPPRGGRLGNACGNALPINFYPRPPRGGRRRQTAGLMLGKYFYPRPPRGGRPAGKTSGMPAHTISIHALREEGDAPRQWATIIHRGFLSTPSARRATCSGNPPRLPGSHFYPRPPRGGRRCSSA